jgi:hypothetical protein
MKEARTLEACVPNQGIEGNLILKERHQINHLYMSIVVTVCNLHFGQVLRQGVGAL